MQKIDDLRIKYRPRNFDQIVGQDEFVAKFRQMALDGAPSDNAILLEGTRGTGKTTSARVLAASLNFVPDGLQCSVTVVDDGSAQPSSPGRKRVHHQGVLPRPDENTPVSAQ